MKEFFSNLFGTAFIVFAIYVFMVMFTLILGE